MTDLPPASETRTRCNNLILLETETGRLKIFFSFYTLILATRASTRKRTAIKNEIVDEEEESGVSSKMPRLEQEVVFIKNINYLFDKKTCAYLRHQMVN